MYHVHGHFTVVIHGVRRTRFNHALNFRTSCGACALSRGARILKDFIIFASLYFRALKHSHMRTILARYVLWRARTARTTALIVHFSCRHIYCTIGTNIAIGCCSISFTLAFYNGARRVYAISRQCHWFHSASSSLNPIRCS